MGERSASTDAYIAQAQPFARPILTRLRELVHQACPEVREGRKWHLISFEGDGILCMMAAFKAHCSLLFWKGGLVLPKAAAQLLRHLTSPKDLPAKSVLLGWMRTAAKLDREGVKTPARKRAAKPGLAMPDDLRSILAAVPAAQRQFAAFPPSAQRDYILWIVESKRAQTRKERLATAISWIAAGKRRNWKYQAKPAGPSAAGPGPAGRGAAKPAATVAAPRRTRAARAQ